MKKTFAPLLKRYEPTEKVVFASIADDGAWKYTLRLVFSSSNQVCLKLVFT